MMISQTPKTAKPSKPHSQSSAASLPSRTSSSSIPSHLVMVELKQRILTSLSKLSDRDTHQIAVEDLEKIIQTLSADTVPMLLNCLYDASADPKPAVKKESIRLLALVCTSYGDSGSTHLTKIIAHIVKRLKDSDSGIRDACRDAIGALSAQYLKGEGENGGLGHVVSLFVKPLFEAMNEQHKGVQAGAAMCMAKMVECASSPPGAAFQKLCPRICKFLNNGNFQAKAMLLPVVASLSQVGVLVPQSLEMLLPCIHDCLGSADWATRKAAADALSALALYSSSLIMEKAPATLRVLEACRFDKIKPVRDSMVEALQLWKNIGGKAGSSENHKTLSHEGEKSESGELSRKSGYRSFNGRKGEPSEEESRDEPLVTCDSLAKAAGILKKKAPALTDKELNADFFQKLESRGSGDLPVEVVVPRRYPTSLGSNSKEESGSGDTSLAVHMGDHQYDDDHDLVTHYSMEKGTASVFSKEQDFDAFTRDMAEERNGKQLQRTTSDFDHRIEVSERESSICQGDISKTEVPSDGSFVSNKGNWLAIQRQLLQLERQQTHLMNMLQDFMGGSHDSMVTLENRVRGLERIVDDMARDLSVSSGKRSGNFMGGDDGSSNRPLSKYGAFLDYSSAKFGRGGDGRIPFGERFPLSDGIRGRGSSWRSDPSLAWNSHASSASRNAQTGSRKGVGANHMDDRLSKSEQVNDQDGSRRAWEKGPGPARLGEGPSARSVWQASKDEATLEAIRVAGEDNGKARASKLPVPELDAEGMGEDNIVQERNSISICWSNAMYALRAGDVDTAYAEVLSTEDDLLLVKLMDRTGPVVDQFSSEITSEVLLALGQFCQEQNYFDICLAWIQQLVEVVMENGPDFLGIPFGIKRELLSNLHEASSALEPPEDFEGASFHQLMVQLASAWEINQQVGK